MNQLIKLEVLPPDCSGTFTLTMNNGNGHSISREFNVKDLPAPRRFYRLKRRHDGSLHRQRLSRRDRPVIPIYMNSGPVTETWETG